MSEIEHGSTNVYADLGMPNAEEMLVKAQLATKIGEIIRRRKLTQVEAAQLLCTLNEIRWIIEVRDGRSSHCAHVLATIRQRAAEIPRKIEDLQEMNYALDALDALDRNGE